MANITELTLFKQCVEKPIVTQVADLHLECISAPQDQSLSEAAIMQRKALKLYHMAWSGITKYLRQVCHGQNRPI